MWLQGHQSWYIVSRGPQRAHLQSPCVRARVQSFGSVLNARAASLSPLKLRSVKGFKTLELLNISVFILREDFMAPKSYEILRLAVLSTHVVECVFLSLIWRRVLCLWWKQRRVFLLSAPKRQWSLKKSVIIRRFFQPPGSRSLCFSPGSSGRFISVSRAPASAVVGTGRVRS